VIHGSGPDDNKGFEKVLVGFGGGVIVPDPDFLSQDNPTNSIHK
jgi:hypothetical protein